MSRLIPGDVFDGAESTEERTTTQIANDTVRAVWPYLRPNKPVPDIVNLENNTALIQELH